MGVEVEEGERNSPSLEELPVPLPEQEMHPVPVLVAAAGKPLQKGALPPITEIDPDPPCGCSVARCSAPRAQRRERLFCRS